MNAINKDAINAYDLRPDLLSDADFLKAANDEDGGPPLQLKEYTIARVRREYHRIEKHIKVEAYSCDHAFHIAEEVLEDSFHDDEDGWYEVDHDIEVGCGQTDLREVWYKEVKNA